MKKILTLIIVATITLCGYTQTTKVVFEYDAAGNRILRKMEEIPILKRSLRNDTTVVTNIEEEPVVQEIKSEIGNMDITFYPNPTKGILQVNITGVEQLAGQYWVFDMQGKLITTSNSLSNSNTVDITHMPPGNYILKIIANQTTKEWKIIKE